VSNPLRLRNFSGFLRDRSHPFAPADRELGRAVLSRRRERPLGAALKLVQEFLTEPVSVRSDMTSLR